MIRYRSYLNLIDDIKNNIWKVPRDIDGIIGIERSGVIVANIISEYISVGVTSFNSFANYAGENVKDLFNIHGGRQIITPKNTGKYLVIDDTVCSGVRLNENMKFLKTKYQDFEFIVLVVYKDGANPAYMPDIILSGQDIFDAHIYEWNLFNNYISYNTLYDFDGVLCLDPPSDENTEEYEAYLKNPTPRFLISIHRNFPINICTYRLAKYSKETLDFIKKCGLIPGKVYMFNAETREERNKIAPYIYKAHVYGNSTYSLFIESNDFEAQMIHQLTSKPVISIEKNILYGN